METERAGMETDRAGVETVGTDSLARLGVGASPPPMGTWQAGLAVSRLFTASADPQVAAASGSQRHPIGLNRGKIHKPRQVMLKNASPSWIAGNKYLLSYLCKNVAVFEA